MISGNSRDNEHDNEDSSVSLDLANAPEEPTDGKYTITKLWDDLDYFLKKHSAANPIPASSELDEKTYALCKSTMDDLYQIGREAEKMHYIKECRKKARHGMRAKNLFTERFGKERVPLVDGIKSASYVNDVILPLIERSSDVMHEKWLKILCRVVGIKLDAEALAAKEAAIKCRKLISFHLPIEQKESVQITTTLKVVGHFAVNTNEGQQAMVDIEEEIIINQQQGI